MFAILLLSVVASAAAFTCANDVVTLPDGGSWGCNLNPTSPSVYSNIHVKVGSFNKEAGCGDNDRNDYRITITCDGTVHWLPDDTHAWYMESGHGADFPVQAAYNCANTFRIDMVNANSWAGAGKCTSTYVNWSLSVDATTSRSLTSVPHAKGLFHGVAHLPKLDGAEPREIKPSLLSMTASAAATFTCHNDVVTNPDGGSWGCDHNPTSPSVYSNVHVKVGSFNKEAGCGDSDHNDYRITITCDGTVHWLPDDTHTWYMESGHGADFPVKAAYNCEKTFRIDMVNANSWAGDGTCSSTYVNWSLAVDVTTSESLTSVPFAKGSSHGVAHLPKLDGTEPRKIKPSPIVVV